MTNLMTRVRAAILATLPGATADTTVVTIEYARSQVGYSARDTWSGTADGLADRIAAALGADQEEDTREGESTPDLGEFIGCSASGCAFGEWSATAAARGWEQRGDGWLCVQCADAASERAEIVARMDAQTSPDSLSYQAQQLLAHIRDLPSFRWTTGKADRVYADLGYPKRGRRHDARSHLHELAARGLLTVHGPHDGRYFLVAQKDGA